MSLAALFQPPDPVDTLTARAVHRTEGLHPAERNLRLAILQDVVDLVAKYGRVADRPADYVEAVRWLQAEEGGPFGFATVCDVLGLDAATIRGEVLSERFLERAAQHRPRRPRDIAWAWAEEQAGPWTLADMALAVGCEVSEVRGYVTGWRMRDRVEVVDVVAGPGPARMVQRYRVRR